VFPCNPDKTPIVKAWEQNATRSLLTIEAKWQSNSQLLPAIPVGAHSLVVIDCDRKPNAPDGVAAFQTLCASHSIDLSGAFVVESPSTGLHFYFRTDTPYGNSRGSLPVGIDVRGLGGYVIGPGATLPDGRSYRIIAGTWDAIPSLPEPLAAFLRPKVDAGITPAPDAPQDATERERAYAAQALEDEVSELAAMRPGDGRNAALNSAAHSLGTMAGAGWIDPAAIGQALMQAASTNGHTAKHGEQQTIKTIQSGLDAGMRKPREPLATAPDVDVSAMVANGIAAYKRKHCPVNAKGKRSINLVRMDSIEEEAITWLWEGFLPKATLTLLGGAIQAGKSTIAMSLAATVTTGGFWPDGSRCVSPGNVIFWSSEEIVKSVVKPRLMVAGANTSRILTIESSLDENGQPCAFDPAQDIPLLRSAILNLGSVSLVIIDPMITAVSGDTNKATDVRRSLQPIVNLAEEFDCTVLGIHHLAKNSEGKSTNDRMLGSQAFAAMARIVLVAAKAEDSENRVLAISKSNISRDTGGFNYTIEGVTFPSPKGKEIKTSRVVWGEALEGSSRSILADAEGEPNGDSSKLGQAKQFLIESLSHQSVGARELIRNAREGCGISEKTLRRAQNALGIKPEHDPRFDGGWKWSLPTANLLRQCHQNPSDAS
jgi:hypothetical protein